MKLIARILVAVLAAAALPVFAQSYPARPVRVIIAFPPGSATDIIGRVIAAKVSELWGQQAVPDNRGGAGGSIASAIVAKANADGYTLLINSNAHVVNPSFYATLPYNTLKDFTDIMPLVAQPNILVVTPGSKIKSVGEFIAEAKANPGKINIAFAGLGSGTHLNTEKFQYDAKIKYTLVAYKGSGEIFPDLLSGRVESYFTPISAGLPYIQAGKLRPLGITSGKRSAQLPNVPTIAESGLSNFEFYLWFGLWGPAGIPEAPLARIRKEFGAALADSAVRGKLSELGNEVMVMTPAQFRKTVQEQIVDTGKIFAAAGIKPQ
jgi:tripartite-type tricarboxylate transporter receptor subunit TctC